MVFFGGDERFSQETVGNYTCHLFSRIHNVIK